MFDVLDPHRLIPARIALSLHPATISALRHAGYIPPIAGADGEGDAGEGDGEGSGAPAGVDTGAGDAGDDWTPPTREQFDAMQEAIAASNRKARDLEKKVAKATTTSKQEAGEFKDLYETEVTKREELIGKVSGMAVRSAVAEVAQRLGFRNPNVAHKLLDLAGIEADVDADTLDAAIDTATKTVIEARLADLVKSDEYLVKPQGNRQVPRADSTNPGGGDGNAEMNRRIRDAAGR